MRAVRVVIVGRNLPGRRFAADGVSRDHVHVGLQERSDPVGLVAADADAARWELDVRVVATEEGDRDFRGPAVHGRRGERFLYLTWGDVGADGSFGMFRRAKLVLDRVEPRLVDTAERTGRPLEATVDLTDDRGCPRCARVDPPAISWRVAS
jgi:hypothetical protein